MLLSIEKQASLSKRALPSATSPLQTSAYPVEGKDQVVNASEHQLFAKELGVEGALC